MMDYNLQSLVSKLNPVCRRALEKAAELCVSQTNYNVEMEHFLINIIDEPDADANCILKFCDLRDIDLLRELKAAVNALRRGSNRTPAISPHLVKLLEQAWMVSSIQMETSKVRSWSVIMALLKDAELRNLIVSSCKSLKKIIPDSVLMNYDDIVRQSIEGNNNGTKACGDTREDEHGAKSVQSKTPALDQYTDDLTKHARAGKIDPIQCREFEIRQIIDILMRRKQNNPILTGDAGVGKTAVVEGLALRIAQGNVPAMLKDISLRVLDLGLLQAGAGVKGEFENRLKTLIKEVQGSIRPVILFIDEAHTLLGAGGTSGIGDAANLLKPALARGELRTIAATTWSEYKKYFEKDHALARRFQVIQVHEPVVGAAIEMLRGVHGSFEKYHDVVILDEAICDAVKLSAKYITGRQLPDKAISVLDTACSRLAVAKNAVPARIEAAGNKLEQMERECSLLRKEQASGLDHAGRIKELETSIAKTSAEMAELDKRWSQEIEKLRNIREAQAALDSSKNKKGRARLLKDIKWMKGDLSKLQKESPMAFDCVDSKMVASVISDWTGIPVGKMMTDEVQVTLNLKPRLEERIIGQPEAMETICRRIEAYRARLDDPGRPAGVFLLVGPSGVGKTETAIALAETLYGGEQKLITINMSEYQEAYTVSGLKGSPPGYVGYGQGGILTEAVRRNPYSVVLLDEVEKAHPEVLELFYSVFDKGLMKDTEGLTIDFKNTVIILTSNACSGLIMTASEASTRQTPAELIEKIRPGLLRHFKPALLGRLVIVPYYPLGHDDISIIAQLKLARIQERFRTNHKAELTYDKELIEAIISRCTEADTGARNVDRIITQNLLPELSRVLLQSMVSGKQIQKAHTYIGNDQEFACLAKSKESLLDKRGEMKRVL